MSDHLEHCENAYYAFACDATGLLRAAICWTAIRTVRLCRNRLLEQNRAEAESRFQSSCSSFPVTTSNLPYDAYRQADSQRKTLTKPSQRSSVNQVNLASLPQEVFDIVESYIIPIKAKNYGQNWPFTRECQCTPTLRGWRYAHAFDTFMDIIQEGIRVKALNFRNVWQLVLCPDPAIPRLRRSFEASGWFGRAIEAVETWTGTRGCSLCQTILENFWDYVTLWDGTPTSQVSCRHMPNPTVWLADLDRYGRRLTLISRVKQN